MSDTQTLWYVFNVGESLKSHQRIEAFVELSFEWVLCCLPCSYDCLEWNDVKFVVLSGAVVQKFPMLLCWLGLELWCLWLVFLLCESSVMSCKSLITFLFRWASDWLVLCSCVGISDQLLNVLCFDFWFCLWTVLRNIAIVLALDLCLDFGSDFVSVLMCWTLR